MDVDRKRPWLWLCCIALLLAFPRAGFGQQAALLAGTVRNGSAGPVAGAQVTVKGVTSGPSARTVTDASGSFSLRLAAGTYDVNVSATGFDSQTKKVSVTANKAPALQFTLTAPPKSRELPNAPSTSLQEPSLQDLGFSPQQMQGNPQLQARLNRRTEMLKIHQKLGVITLLPMAADLVTGPMAKAKGRNGRLISEPTQTNLDLHAALGSTTAALYVSTASFAIFAPKISGVKRRGAIRVHEALAFVHGPGMILTPILGSMAFSQEQAGEKVHGIAAAHGFVAYTTVIAYTASIIAVSWPIHLRFWKKK
jgi:hypothetical protein